MKTEQLGYLFLDAMTDPTKFKSFQVKLKEAASPKIKLRKTATYTVQSVQKPSKVFKNYQLHIGRNWYNADHFRLVSELTEQQEQPIEIETLKAFSDNYQIPKGVDVICLGNSLFASKGDKGTTLEKSEIPFIKWESGTKTAVHSSFLAPINPSDHPDYQPDHSVTDETIKEIPIPSGSVKAGDVINVIAKFKAEEIDNKLKQLNDSFELEFKYFEPTKPHPDNQTVNTLIQYVSEHKDKMSKESINHFASLIGLIKLGAL
jgi:hypothetical protein